MGQAGEWHRVEGGELVALAGRDQRLVERVVLRNEGWVVPKRWS